MADPASSKNEEDPMKNEGAGAKCYPLKVYSENLSLKVKSPI